MMTDRQDTRPEVIEIRKSSCSAMLREAESTYSRSFSSLEYFFCQENLDTVTRERIIPLLCEMTGILHQYINFLKERMVPEYTRISEETGEELIMFQTNELISAQGLILMLGTIEKELRTYNVLLALN